ncbi:ATP-binding protein [Amycolatopsis jejuensis]|uniref:ATP-binding protein n=1 Tax=Amycolatopsis jejuensis TaxID=330084 RepID=UPI00068E83CE|nr:ATP-binding protein [Amycolatopsis jejuensis]
MPALQVQAPPVHYRNNESQLNALTRIHDEAADRVAMAIVRGAPGSGRTTLCETWLHRHLDRFDRFFPVRLGHRAGADVLAELLAMLGYRPDEMPGSLEARSAMWRIRTAKYRVALLVDDALSAAEVKALLPTHAGSYVLVVGSGLTGLQTRHSAREVELEPLSHEAALGVLTELVGEDRLAAEPGQRDELIRICAGSAAELTVAGALLAKSPNRPLQRLVARIREKGALASPVFDVAYERLTEPAQAAYRVFGAHPGDGDVRLETVAAVLGFDEFDTEDLVQELVDAMLVEDIGGRYRMSALARLHAAPLAGELSAAVVGYYAKQSLAIAENALPRGWAGKVWPGFTAGSLSAEDARTWLFAEHANLVAAAEAALLDGTHEDVIRLAMALWPVYKDGGYPVELAAVSQDAVQAAQAGSLPLAEGLARTQLGFARMQRREWAAAQEQFSAVVELAATPEEYASAVEALGLACFEPGLLARRQGRPEEADRMLAQAEHHLRRNLALAEEIGVPRRLGLARMHLAKVAPPAEAAALLVAAEEALGAEPDNRVKIRLWRGRKLIEAGSFEEGAAELAELGPVAERLGMHRERIAALWSCAEAALARGYRDQAKAHVEDALGIARLRGYSAEAADLVLVLDQLG